MKKIVVLVDFTEVASVAIDHAALFATKSSIQLVLLHIAADSKKQEDYALREKLKTFGNSLTQNGISFDVQVDYGDFFGIINDSLQVLNADLVVVGTHGISVKGSFAGSAIFQLLHLINIPALIVQGHSLVPKQGFLKILLPMIGKTENVEVAKDVANFGAAHDATVHLLSFYSPENETDMRNRTNDMAKGLNAGGLKTYIDLERTLVAGDYARSIIEYSDIEETDAIVLMISQKYDGYFGTEDQENILLNRLCKPVLCL